MIQKAIIANAEGLGFVEIFCSVNEEVFISSTSDDSNDDDEEWDESLMVTIH